MSEVAERHTAIPSEKNMLNEINLPHVLTVIFLSGLYTSLWGSFKDCPYEGFKKITFWRSVLFSFFIGLFFLWAEKFTNWGVSLSRLNTVQLFFFVMGIERFLSELYKGFFRFEDQKKYFIPSRFTFFGRPVKSEWVRIPLGIVFVGITLATSFLPGEITGFLGFLSVAYGAGLFVSLGGAYKDAPFEGFAPLKFQRSGFVLALMAPFFWSQGPVSLGVLIFMNGGLERFLVEYYKTYIKRNMSGKFRSDLKIFKKEKANRERFHYAAWIIIIWLVWEFIKIKKWF